MLTKAITKHGIITTYTEVKHNINHQLLQNLLNVYCEYNPYKYETREG